MKTNALTTNTITTNNGVINNTINNTVNIIINNYTTPNAEHLLTFEKFTEIFKKAFVALPVELVFKLYFDPEHHENMSVHLINKSTGEMLTMCEGNWKTMNIDDVAMKMRSIGYEIAKKGIELHRKGFVGDIKYCCENVILNVSNPKTIEMDMKDIRAKIVESREITGSAPHISAKLEATRAVGRVRKGINTNNDDNLHVGDIRGDNIA